MAKNFPVVCENGRINVTLEKPSNIDVDENYSMVVIYNSQHQLPVNESSHSKVKAAISNEQLLNERVMYINTLCLIRELTLIHVHLIKAQKTNLFNVELWA